MKNLNYEGREIGAIQTSIAATQVTIAVESIDRHGDDPGSGWINLRSTICGETISACGAWLRVGRLTPEEDASGDYIGGRDGYFAPYRGWEKFGDDSAVSESFATALGLSGDDADKEVWNGYGAALGEAVDALNRAARPLFRAALSLLAAEERAVDGGR